MLQLPISKHNLLHLDISNNGFIGKLPQDMGIVIPKLESLDISENSFDKGIPSSIGEMKELVFMDLSRNKLSGNLSGPLFTGCFSLWFLDLFDNNFYGKHFPKYMNLTRLESLYLNNNRFSGKIDDGLLTSTRLEVLDISSNMLTDQVPHWIDQRVKVGFVTKNRYEIYSGSNLDYMAGLDLSSNALTGEIPSEIGELQEIRVLNLSRNSLSGSIPESFSNLKMIEFRPFLQQLKW
ncbi:Leucine-rich repeat receptor-like protein kinase family protein [Melia azedarach]|uniref:Leucine-rich repeat receptor-like protein kinase family protein n=1 Tax=Melia azedarach TaxID=155640 RepID=A0ACC1YXN9_MELAZ|nr:Leucine-rich repeat receptor-like protein kinase family protein [Melia azedarach]